MYFYPLFPFLLSFSLLFHFCLPSISFRLNLSPVVTSFWKGGRRNKVILKLLHSTCPLEVSEGWGLSPYLNGSLFAFLKSGTLILSETFGAFSTFPKTQWKVMRKWILNSGMQTWRLTSSYQIMLNLSRQYTCSFNHPEQGLDLQINFCSHVKSNQVSRYSRLLKQHNLSHLTQTIYIYIHNIRLFIFMLWPT